MPSLSESPLAFAIKAASKKSLTFKDSKLARARNCYSDLLLSRSLARTADLETTIATEPDDGWSIINLDSTCVEFSPTSNTPAFSDNSPEAEDHLSNLLAASSLESSSDSDIVGSTCIIGAGMAGLYTAMILDSLDLPYTIYEGSKDRIGGRVFTHYFNSSNQLGDEEARKKQRYVELGAMRFHDGPSMARLEPFLFNLKC